ncbi:MAG: mechanosensitive ion channel family protein [Myxococcota bacterium]
MSIIEQILDELRISYTLAVFVGLLFTATLVRAFARGERRRVRVMTLALIGHVVLAVVAALARSEKETYPILRLVSLAAAEVAVVGMLITVVFAILTPRLGFQVPPIISDVIGAVMFVTGLLVLANGVGVNLIGLAATSAILTAVIGLSLQDTLGNLVAGIALQADSAFRVGDWVKVQDTVGKITAMRWRYISIETRNGETLVVPNGALVKDRVLVLGKRVGKPLQWRRWVYFNVDYRFAPGAVMDAAKAGLDVAHLPRVAAEPAPDVIFISYESSYARYAIRYWLTDLQVDDPTDSEVRRRLYAALKRAHIPLSIPAEARFITTDDESRKAHKSNEDLARRAAALAEIDLFAGLSNEDRVLLAAHMRMAPFAAGEPLTRQGADAHWLYLIASGEVSVRIAAGGAEEREVARLHAGQIFGEMSLMTGEKRSATVVALCDVDAYRLDRDGFDTLLKRRPEIAEQLAETLAKRRVEQRMLREQISREEASARMSEDTADMLDRIRGFFGLDAN